MRKTKEEAAATHKAILDAALKVFSRQGYTATRLEDVAQEAGITRGAIYWHFASKADLYNAIVSDANVRSNDVVNRAVAEGGTFLDICRRVMIALLEYVEEDETFHSVMELMLLKTELVPELEEGMQVKAEATRALMTVLSKFFRRAIERGEVRADLDPVIGAESMFTYVNGIALTWLMNQDMFSLRDSASALVDVYIRGIAASSTV